jgi:hypothetical protein
MYRFTVAARSQTPVELWSFIIDKLNAHNDIYSIKNIKYEIVTYSSESITYRAPTRNGFHPETLPKQNIIDILTALQHAQRFDTANAKAIFNQANLYKKRSPVFALLLTLKLIEPTKP